MTRIEENTLTATNDNTVFIADVMAFIHKKQDFGCSSFSDLQQRLLKKLLSVCPTQCTCVNVVGDRYYFESTKSLKYEERIRRQQRAVIQATDTDIFIMAIYYSVRIPGLKEL